MKSIIIRKNQKGQAALLIVLVTMTLLLFVGLTLTNMTIKRTRATGDALKSVQAYYLADAGAERLLYLSKAEGTINPGDASYAVGDTLFSETIPNIGTIRAVKENASPLSVKVTGKFNNTARAVELSWN